MSTTSPVTNPSPVRIAAPFTIKDLSAATGVKGAEIVKKLFLQGIVTTINAGIEPAKAQEIMIDFDIDLDVVESKTAEETVTEEFAGREAKDLRPRGPVVTILVGGLCGCLGAALAGKGYDAGHALTVRAPLWAYRKVAGRDRKSVV